MFSKVELLNLVLLVTLVNLVLLVISMATLLEVYTVVSWGVRWLLAGLTAGRGQLGLTRFNTAANINTDQY